jgi:tRNA G18 (ribose-2'-O)-methylase SpoU
VPWTRLDNWADGMAVLHTAGFVVAALALDDAAVDLTEFVGRHHDRIALVLGAEGDGLSRVAVSSADVVVRIPMAGGVDSLNVAAASAVALWAVRAGARPVADDPSG